MGESAALMPCLPSLETLCSIDIVLLLGGISEFFLISSSWGSGVRIGLPVAPCRPLLLTIVGHQIDEIAFFLP